MTDFDAAAADGLGNVRALQPARVILAGRDKRFIKMAAFLLARRGYQVSQAATDNELMSLADNQSIDVVVLDASMSLSSSLRTAAALTAVHPHLRVILATDRSTSAVESTYTRIDKWRGLGALPDEVARVQLGLGAETPPLQAS
jgi:ActR/RegA family two-component response regulator